jgi:hypothetical protein
LVDSGGKVFLVYWTRIDPSHFRNLEKSGNGGGWKHYRICLLAVMRRASRHDRMSAGLVSSRGLPPQAMPLT